MLPNRILYLASLIGAAAYFFSYDGWLAALVGIAVLAAPVISLLCTLPLLRRHSGRTLIFPERIDCLQGEEVRIAVRVPKDGKLCLPFLLRIAAEDLMSGRIRKKSLTLEPGEEKSVPVDTVHCGCVECRILRCRVCDFLGLFRLPVKKPGICTVYIGPRPVEPDPAPDFTVFRQGGCRPKPGGGNAEIHELRGYRPGDPVSQIHWKLSAKRDELIIREPQEAAELSAETVLETPGDRNALDRILGEALWTGREMTEREIAGSLGWLGMTAHPVSDGASLTRAMESLLRTGIADFPLRDERAASFPGRIILTGRNGGGT